MNNRSRFIPLAIYIMVLLAAFTWLGDIFGSNGNTIAYSEVVSLFRREQVKEFLVEGDQLTMLLYEPYLEETKVTTTLSDPDGFRAEMQDTFLAQTDSGILLSYDFVSVPSFSPYDLVLPLIIVGLVLLFIWTLLMGRMNNNNPLQNFIRQEKQS